MGASHSQEVVISGPGPLKGVVTEVAQAQHARDESLLREGFHRGFSEAATQLNVEVERAAGAAFARALEAEEGARATQLADAVAQLRKEQFRAPRRALECAAEETAVLACEDPAASEPLIRAYVACAREVVAARMLHPPGGLR